MLVYLVSCLLLRQLSASLAGCCWQASKLLFDQVISVPLMCLTDFRCVCAAALAVLLELVSHSTGMQQAVCCCTLSSNLTLCVAPKWAHHDIESEVLLLVGLHCRCSRVIADAM